MKTTNKKRKDDKRDVVAKKPESHVDAFLIGTKRGLERIGAKYYPGMRKQPRMKQEGHPYWTGAVEK